MGTRRPRVTAPTPTPRIRMMHDDAPDTYAPTGRTTGTVVPRVTHRDRSTNHRVIIDRETGFTADVTTGRTIVPNTDDGRYVARPGTSAPNADDRRHPMRRDTTGRPVITHRDVPTGPSRRVVTNTSTGARMVVDDNVNGGIASWRPVRLTTDGDAPLPGIRRRADRSPRTTAPRTTGRPTTDRPVNRTTMDDVTAFAAAHGITLPTDRSHRRRVVAAIRDVMAHRASVAAYAGR